MTSTPAVQSSSAVALRDAAVQIGDALLWHDVNVDVPAGQFVAILGPNGVGKSTLIKAVLGVIPLAAGEADVFGQPAGTANREIGYLPQRRSFDPSLRVRGIDVVRLGLDGDRFGLPLPWSAKNREAGRRVRDVIDRVDASSFALRPIGELSGGEQQRLLIAQALVRDPRLLILDEPLDSLDLPNQSAIAELIRRVCVDGGVTVLMVAHDVNPILSALDRVVYVAHGKIAVGTPDEVITTETLSRLYNTPIEVLRASDGRLVVVGQADEEVSYHAHHPR